MTLLSLEKIVGCEGYYIDDKTFQIYSFKQDYKNGKLMKPNFNKKDGYLCYNFCVNGKFKRILYHVIIVKMFINPDYDSTKYDIDHKDHNRTNNSIENLHVVSRLENNRNISKSWNGKKFNFVDNIGRSLTINEEAQIYYSLELDKFFMFIEHTNKYKELHEHIRKDDYLPYIAYRYNNKFHYFRTTNFRKNLNKKC